MSSPSVALLEQHAEEFAAELTATVQGVLGASVPRFVAEASPRPEDTRTRVKVQPEASADISLTVGGVPALSLLVDYECMWDSAGRYLAVRKSCFQVGPLGRGAPLFRYDYVESMQERYPSAHVQVHAHRDEFLFALVRGSASKQTSRAKAVLDPTMRPPQLSDVHFPVGGPRMRPCLEDVLQMLHTELGIDVVDGFQEVLNRGRMRWRCHQVGTVVRDAPEDAARVLTELGYHVTLPPAGHPRLRTERLTRI